MKLQTPKTVKLMEVICIETSRGSGTDEDPARLVLQYWDKDGTLLAENDTWQSSAEPISLSIK